MNAEIIAVGTELLMGQINNTNARYISSKISDADVYVYYHTVVGDNPARLAECIRTAMNRVDVILLTGGLGPTQDDLTKETVAGVLGIEMIANNQTMKAIAEFFKERGRKACPNNKKQAYFPKGSTIIRNKKGTAPGCIIEHEEKIIILLPGPPWEMEPMFDNFIMPYFMKNAVHSLHSVYVRMFGIGESDMEDRIKDLVSKQQNPTIAPYAKMGEITLRVTAKYIPGKDNPEQMIKPVMDEINNRLGKYIYSTKNEELHEKVANMLMEKGTTLALAESCTGGRLASMLTDIPGISTVFKGGVVSYTNDMKTSLLGVSDKSIISYGAVSEKTAVEMAKGIRNKAHSDIGLSITGFAGPEGGTFENPIGLVYIALATEKGVKTQKLNLWGDRERIRHTACLNALNIIIKYLRSY